MMMTWAMSTKIKIVYKNIGELHEYENNPRLNDEAVESVKQSIRQFGWKVPIVIDKDGVIVTGHTRVRAARELGITDIPCIVATDLSPKQVKAFRLVDNKTSELSGWDFSKLDVELQDLNDIFNMGDFGFIDYDAFDTPVIDVPETPDSVPITDTVVGSGGGNNAKEYTLLVQCFNQADLYELQERMTDEGRRCRML